jgi:hypothetical protein
MYSVDKFKEEFNIRTKNKQIVAMIQLKDSKAIIIPDKYRYHPDDNTVWFYRSKKLIAIVPLADIADVR